MTLAEYQALAQRTSHAGKRSDKLENACLGLAGECGEACDIVKKALFQGHALDRAGLIEEAGDVLWYLAELAAGLGVSLEDMAVQNVMKLRRRYPSGFDAGRSRNRGTDGENGEGNEGDHAAAAATYHPSGYRRPPSPQGEGLGTRTRELNGVHQGEGLQGKEPEEAPRAIWIATAERMPRKGALCAVAGRDAGRKISFYDLALYDGDKFVAARGREAMITHWMELAEMPEK